MFRWNPFTMHGDYPGMHRFISFGSSESESKPVQLSALNPVQQAIMDALGQKLLPASYGAVPSYPRKMYVERTPEEEQYFNALYGERPGRMEAINRLMSGKPAYEVTPETTEQLFQSGVKAPMMQEWREIGLPAIKEAFAGTGYWGSARATEQARGAETLATTLGAKRAELAYADEQARRASLESAAARVPAGVAATTSEMEMMGTGAQYSRMIDQEKVLADLQRWLMGETVDGVTPTQYNPFTQAMLQFLNIKPYEYGQESESSSWNFGVSY